MLREEHPGAGTPRLALLAHHSCPAGLTVATSDLAKLTAIIRTSQRPKSIGRLLKSIRRHYPGLKTLVADDGTEPTPCKQTEYFRLPSQKGLASAYNALLARVRTPYFLVLDEQAEIHRETRLETLVELVASDRLDLAGGSLVASRRKWWFFTTRKPLALHGLLEIAGDRLTQLPGSRSQGEGFWWCDFVTNFFIARTDRIRSLGGWDPELHDEPLEEFFVRAQRRGIRVGIQSAASVWLWDEVIQEKGYEPQHDHLSLAVAKMGLEEMTNLDGRVIRAPRISRAA